MTGPSVSPDALVLKRLGERLTAYRQAHGVRPETLAQQAGIPRAALHQIETGRGGTLEHMLAVLTVLGLEDRLADLVPDPNAGTGRIARRKLMSGPATHSPNYGKSGEWKPGR